MHSRRILTAVAVVPFLIGAAACSDNSTTSGDSKPSASSTGDAGNGDGGGPTLTTDNFAARLTAAQADAGTAHMEGKIAAAGTGAVTLSADLRLDPQDAAAHMTMTSPQFGQDIEAILLDETMYLKVPGLPPSKPWLKMDLSNAPLPGLGSLDASAVLRGLEGAITLKPLGQEDVSGVDARHYEVTVDAKQAIEALGGTGSVPAGQLPKRLTYDVWVDDQDLVRRISMEISTVSIDMTFSDYGEPVDISAPPAGQITKQPTG